ncbi:MAG: DUF2760 domain-containing protein [Candidatus Rokubacteria bacterium]|nr:DUF2760 domain-containing protein [Candidatus Rokubacteria bacterium]
MVLAFRCLFDVLLHGRLSDQAATALRLGTASAAPASAAAPPVRPGEAALQLLAILQRDSRLVDFLMEDISGYSDDQVGAAVRELHDQCRQSLTRYVRLVPVIDAVENARTTVPGGTADPSAVKFIGNVPAQPPSAGILRHKGWRAASIELPPAPRDGAAVIAPAEIEVEE